MLIEGPLSALSSRLCTYGQISSDICRVFWHSSEKMRNVTSKGTLEGEQLYSSHMILSTCTAIITLQQLHCNKCSATIALQNVFAHSSGHKQNWATTHVPRSVPFDKLPSFSTLTQSAFWTQKSWGKCVIKAHWQIASDFNSGLYFVQRMLESA